MGEKTKGVKRNDKYALSQSLGRSDLVPESKPVDTNHLTLCLRASESFFLKTNRIFLEAKAFIKQQEIRGRHRFDTVL